LNASINSSDPNEDPTLLHLVEAAQNASEEEREDMFAMYSNMLLMHVEARHALHLLCIDSLVVYLGEKYGSAGCFSRI